MHFFSVGTKKNRLFIFFKATPSFQETSGTLVSLSDITVIKWENNKDIVSCITYYVIVFKRLFGKLLGLNRDKEFTKQYFSASYHPKYKWHHDKIIMKTKSFQNDLSIWGTLLLDMVLIKAISFFLEAEWDVAFPTLNERVVLKFN